MYGFCRYLLEGLLRTQYIQRKGVEPNKIIGFNMNPERLAQQLLEKVRKNEEADEELDKLADIEFRELCDCLKDRDSKTAFFLNYYNAEAQRLAKKHSLLHKLKLVYLLPFPKLSGERISLNTVENGILRSSKRKINLRNSRFVRLMHLEEVDPRIHFALNCASNSCPPIRFYTQENIDSQLEVATKNYLNQEADIDGEMVSLPRMFKWYSSDFNDIEEFISKYIEIPENPEFKYKSFDWGLKINNFVEE